MTGTPRPSLPSRPAVLPPPPHPTPPKQPCGGLPGRRFTDTGILLGLASEPDLLDEVAQRWGDRLVIVDRIQGELYGISRPTSGQAPKVRAAAAVVHDRMRAGTLPSALRLTDSERTYARTLRAQMGAIKKIPDGQSEGEAHVLSALLRHGDRLNDVLLVNDDVPARLARNVHGVATGPISAVLRETVHAGNRTAEEAMTLYARLIAISGVPARLRVIKAADLACTC